MGEDRVFTGAVDPRNEEIPRGLLRQVLILLSIHTIAVKSRLEAPYLPSLRHPRDPYNVGCYGC